MVAKIAKKFSPRPTPVLRSQNGDMIMNHVEVAEREVDSFAAVAGDYNYPVQFLRHKNRIENRLLVFNEAQAIHKDYN